MALKNWESFDCFTTADLPNIYTAFGHVQLGGTMTATIVEGGGRNGDKCLRIIPGSHALKNLTHQIQGKSFSTGVSAGDTVVCHFAMKVNTFNESGFCYFAAIQSNAGVGDGLYNILLAINAAKQIVVGHSVSSTLSAGNFTGVSTTILAVGVWVHVAVKFKAHATTGTVEVQINGITEIGPLTSIDTSTSDTGVSALVLGATIPDTVIPSIDFDDVVICDTSGTTNNDFLGDQQVLQRKPVGNGNSSQLLGSDANSTDNYLLVDDDTDPDDDTTYNQSATTGDKDTYAYEDLPAEITTIKAVGVRTIGKKLTAAAKDVKAVARSSGTEADSGPLGFIDGAYTARRAVFEVDPNTSTAWTPTTYNAAEFGAKIA